MIIISDKFAQTKVKIPNNLNKTDSYTLVMRNTETKVEEWVYFDQDYTTSDLYYLIDVSTFSSLSDGEYEYNIDGNIGIIRIGQPVTKKIYNEDITFKAYEG